MSIHGLGNAVLGGESWCWPTYLPHWSCRSRPSWRCCRHGRQSNRSCCRQGWPRWHWLCCRHRPPSYKCRWLARKRSCIPHVGTGAGIPGQLDLTREDVAGQAHQDKTQPSQQTRDWFEPCRIELSKHCQPPNACAARTERARRLVLRSLGNPATMPRRPGIRPVVLRPALSERFALFKLSSAIWMRLYACSKCGTSQN